jgi:hypothetical protein
LLPEPNSSPLSSWFAPWPSTSHDPGPWGNRSGGPTSLPPILHVSPPLLLTLYSHSDVARSIWVSTTFSGLLGLTASPGPDLPRTGSVQSPKR